jgi:hypothetical protein
MQHLQRHGTRLDFGTEEDLADLECAIAARWSRRREASSQLPTAASVTQTDLGGGRTRRHDSVPMAALARGSGTSTASGPRPMLLNYDDDDDTSPDARLAGAAHTRASAAAPRTQHAPAPHQHAAGRRTPPAQ